MAVESYDQIMARLNNPYGYAPVQPKTPASDFTQYVQTLMANTNPQGGMFGMQDIIDERMRKSKEAAAAKTAQAAGGMFVPVARGGGGDSGGNVELTPEQIAFLERETPEERYARITGDWFGLKPIGATMFGGLGGLNAYLNQQTPTLNDLLYKSAVYDKTPSWLQGILPESYQQAAERAKEYQRVMNGITPYEEITPTFDYPSDNIMETGTPYEEITPTFDYPSSGDSSGNSGGGGGWSTPTMSDPYGGVI